VPALSNVISIAAFREMLAERFPEGAKPVERHWPTGWPAIDDEAGGLRQGAVTELCSTPACGRFFLDCLLTTLWQRGSFAGLVDCGRTLDPGSYDPAVLSRLLAVFCDTADLAVKATDLLLRDGNLPLVLLDLQSAVPRQIGRIPASTWHRFQRLVEKSGATLLALTPQPLVEAARIRITLSGQWDLATLKRPRRELTSDIDVQVFHRGRQMATTTREEAHAQTA
jgi:hypothetical protein